MKIERDQDNVILVPLSDVRPGMPFMHKGSIYLATRRPGQSVLDCRTSRVTMDCVCLRTGAIRTIDIYTKVEPVKAKVVFE